MYLATENDKVTGLTVVASEPHALTIVNIVGSFDFEKLEQLRDRFAARERDESSAQGVARRL
ncbi:MAG: hypothetical protein WDO68_01030 [Gammaproteobacteria bacterium]